MSLLRDYHKERFGWETYENSYGFIVYDLAPPEASIEELYVVPERRGERLAAKFADHVLKEAKKANCERVWLRVTPGTGGAESAMSASLRYGFKMHRFEGQSIIMMKEIGGGDGKA